MATQLLTYRQIWNCHASQSPKTEPNSAFYWGDRQIYW
jgi:hypothetical protein